MYISSVCSISPQDTFLSGENIPSMRILEGNRWSCIEPDYKLYIPDATLRRRMSRIVKMGVAAALRCVAQAQVQPDAIITATGLGCLADTEKFLDNLIDNEQLLNPTPFIQSTFNTVGAQVALMLGNHGYNNTYVHRGFSFESALLDAMMQLADNGTENILVGCFDEITDTSFEIMHRLGFWKDGLANSTQIYNETTNGSAAGEGATFFMLGNQPTDRPSVQLSGVKFFNTPVDDGSFFRQVDDFLASMQKKDSDVDLLILGNNGDITNDQIYHRLVSERFPTTAYCFFKNLCGEYPTASGFALYLAMGVLTMQRMSTGIVHHGKTPSAINNILIYNHYQNKNHSLMFCQV